MYCNCWDWLRRIWTTEDAVFSGVTGEENARIHAVIQHLSTPSQERTYRYKLRGLGIAGWRLGMFASGEEWHGKQVIKGTRGRLWKWIGKNGILVLINWHLTVNPTLLYLVHKYRFCSVAHQLMLFSVQLSLFCMRSLFIKTWFENNTMLNEVIWIAAWPNWPFSTNRFVSEMYIPLIGVDLIKCVLNRIVPSIHQHNVTSNQWN